MEVLASRLLRSWTSPSENKARGSRGAKGRRCAFQWLARETVARVKTVTLVFQFRLQLLEPNAHPTYYQPTNSLHQHRYSEAPIRTCMVFLNHVQFFKIHAVRSNFLVLRSGFSTILSLTYPR